MFDGKAFGLEVVGAVKAHVADVMAPIMKRLDEIEARLAEPAVSEDDLSAIKSDVESLRTAIADLPPAKDGKDADPEQVASLVAETVERAVAVLPAPKDGKSVSVDELRPLVEESVTKAVSALPAPKDGNPGKDGVGLAGAIIDRSGNLTLTLTDGSTRDLGLIVGKDAEPGKPGVDGLGFEDLTEDLADDGRTIVRRYQRGDLVKEFRHKFPVVLDRGVFKDGQTYQAGDGVTWAGSFWIAQEETSEKPDSGKGFRLAVKRGRDGKDKA